MRWPEHLAWHPVTTQWLLVSHILHQEPVSVSLKPKYTSVVLGDFSEVKQWSFHELFGVSDDNCGSVSRVSKVTSSFRGNDTT